MTPLTEHLKNFYTFANENQGAPIARRNEHSLPTLSKENAYKTSGGDYKHAILNSANKRMSQGHLQRSSRVRQSSRA